MGVICNESPALRITLWFLNPISSFIRTTNQSNLRIKVRYFLKIYPLCDSVLSFRCFPFNRLFLCLIFDATISLLVYILIARYLVKVQRLEI